MVTPEAVRLDFQAANIGSRFVALIIDLFVVAASLMLLAFAGGFLSAAGAFEGIPDSVGITLVLLLVFGVFWGYPVGMETLWRGRTLGKAAMGLRVVTVDGGPIGFRHAAIRAALGLVDFQATGGLAAVISALATRRHQRLGDLVAGTLVIVERTGAVRPEAVTFDIPPGTGSYAVTLDVTGLRSRDYVTVRAFLLRAPSIDATPRAGLAEALATPIARRLNHTVPDGITAELFLRCVAARYQQRGTAETRPVETS